MPTYIRLGIRMLHQQAGSRRGMQVRGMRRLLQALTEKQGRRFDDPASRKNIAGFIAFHGIQMDEVRESVDAFNTFNEFFYRKLKEGARPIFHLPDTPGMDVDMPNFNS